MMARRVNPRGAQRASSQFSSVRGEQHRICAASAHVSRRPARQATISLWKCAMLVAREPALSGIGVGVVLRFAPILCQPVLAGNHH